MRTSPESQRPWKPQWFSWKWANSKGFILSQYLLCKKALIITPNPTPPLPASSQVHQMLSPTERLPGFSCPPFSFFLSLPLGWNYYLHKGQKIGLRVPAQCPFWKDVFNKNGGSIPVLVQLSISKWKFKSEKIYFSYEESWNPEDRAICPRSLNCGVWAGIWRSLTECCPALAQVYKATSQSNRGLSPEINCSTENPFRLSQGLGSWLFPRERIRGGGGRASLRRQQTEFTARLSTVNAERHLPANSEQPGSFYCFYFPALNSLCSHLFP